MQFLRIKLTYHSFMNLPHCSCISYALYITENFIDNNRALFRHSCALPRITLGFMKQCTRLHTHTCLFSLTEPSQHIHLSPVHSVWYQNNGVWYVNYEVWYQNYGVLYRNCGVWYRNSGVWHQNCGLWYKN